MPPSKHDIDIHWDNEQFIAICTTGGVAHWRSEHTSDKAEASAEAGRHHDDHLSGVA